MKNQTKFIRFNCFSQVKTWFQNRRMKHKKHLRKQSSGRSPIDATGSEEKDLSDYEDVPDEGEEEQDEQMNSTSEDKFENDGSNCGEDEASAPKNVEQSEANIEGK